MQEFSIVVAATVSKMGIGSKGLLPWRLKEDMEYFKTLTTTTVDKSKINAVIMGRKTWDSIPSKFKPLSNRINIIISRNPNPLLREELHFPNDDTTFIASSFEEALTLLLPFNTGLSLLIENIFVIGGGSIYETALLTSYSNMCSKIYLTEILTEFPDDVLDTYFPIINAGKFNLFQRSSLKIENGVEFRFAEYRKILNETVVPLTPLTSSLNTEEQSYLDIVKDIIENGVLRGDRTGTGTLSKFGVQMRFNLRDGVFPLLTTKKVFWRGVAEELVWFISGSTNANVLKEKGIHIWSGNGSKEFLDKLGLVDRVEGDLGPVYGFQWRHFGASYVDMHTDYSGKGLDQLVECIETIKHNPESRRIVLTAWNPTDLSIMALPPCHMLCQFYVANGELSCQMYQRSADMGLGVPFNIASYSLLTVLIAQVCGLKAGDFVHSIGDAHVYVNHVDALKEQLTRNPRPFPSLQINPEVKDIDAFAFSDFKIVDYNPYPAIHMDMAV